MVNVTKCFLNQRSFKKCYCKKLRFLDSYKFFLTKNVLAGPTSVVSARVVSPRASPA